jgi:hypothetical protein
VSRSRYPMLVPDARCRAAGIAFLALGIAVGLCKSLRNRLERPPRERRRSG